MQVHVMKCETKEFQLAAVLGAATGLVLAERGFGDIHEVAEFVIGHPIWTHEFADAVLVEQLRDTILLQYPGMRAAVANATTVTDAETAEAFVNRWAPVYGRTVMLIQGTNERVVSPVDTLRAAIGDDKPVVVVGS